jgi:hypothetical protein
VREGELQSFAVQPPAQINRIVIGSIFFFSKSKGCAIARSAFHPAALVDSSLMQELEKSGFIGAFGKN